MPISSYLTVGWKSDLLLTIVKQPELQMVQMKIKSRTSSRLFITIRPVLHTMLKAKAVTMYGQAKHWTTIL